MKINKILSSGVLIFLYPSFCFSQVISDYTPIGNTGTVPMEFKFDPVEATKQNIKIDDYLSEEEAKEFYSSMNFYKKSIFESGNLYLENEVSSYISSIVSRLQAANPQIGNGFKIYLTRSVEPNAACLPDGSIFINIGLLSVLENESQLAFVIAHEIAHYLKQHSVKDFKRLAVVTQYETKSNNQFSNIFRKLKMSRDSEFDADGIAIQYIIQSDFDANEAGAALLKLDPELHSISAQNSIDFNKYFNSAYFSYDTTWFNNKEIEMSRKGYNSEDDSEFVTNDVVDLYKSHPDLEKRESALNEIILNVETQITENPAKSDNFARFRELAMFEMVENNLRNANYINASYFALSLLQQYPDNVYLYSAVAKSLFWISYFKEINDGKLVVKEPLITSNHDFFWLYTLLRKLDIPQSKKLSYSFAKITYERYAKSEALLFYLGLSTESYLGKNAAYIYYNRYLSQYPQGAFTSYVKSKLN